eukprot:jgi/Picsp_1/6340/NSC_03689-R1_family protein
MGRAPRLVSRAVSNTTAHTNSTGVRVIRPPTEYDHRLALRSNTLKIIRGSYPELEDLALSGNLIAIQRPYDYVERRSDGYQEPEMVFVIGTAHISEKSQIEVSRVIEAIKPENVVVELCRSRSSLLYDNKNVRKMNDQKANALDLNGENFFETIQRSLYLGGRSALFLRILLSYISSNITKDLGVESGGEFKAAQVAADKIGAQVVLGDRPIEITLRRAWVSLPFQSRVRLVLDLFQTIRSYDWKDKEGTIKAVERLKEDDDAVNSLLNALGDQFPQTIDSLVHERDLYLAWSLKRSKAVNGTSNVVGVIGKGHLRGVCYAMTHDPGSLRFKDLVSRNEGDKQATVINNVGRFALESALFIALWWSYSQLH